MRKLSLTEIEQVSGGLFDIGFIERAIALGRFGVVDGPNCVPDNPILGLLPWAAPRGLEIDIRRLLPIPAEK